MSITIYEKLGPVGRRRSRIFSAIAAIVVLGALAWGALRLRADGVFAGENWKILLDTDLLTLMLNGLGSTLQAGAAAAVLSLLGGAVLVYLRLSNVAIVRNVTAVFIEVARGLPALLFIFFVFVGLPAIGIPTPIYWTLVIGLTCYNAPGFAEIFRSGVAALPDGQRQAGLSLGLTRGQCFRSIILPQAIFPTVPAIISQLVMLLKETALGFIIGFNELLRRGQGAVEFLGGRYAIPVYVLVGAIYVVLCLVLSGLATAAARKWQRG